MTDAVRIENVSFSYGEAPALRDVSLTIAEGEFLGLIGPNGSGKTTLLSVMLGLVEPDEGSVELFGEPIESFEDGHRIGYVSQKSTEKGTAMPVTVEEVVEMGRYPHVGSGRLREEDHQAVEAAMARVDITDLADRKLNTLSGGQRQRAFIARALASDADLLALDEPTVGVDAESRDRFYGLLDELNSEGITIVLIEHDIGVVTDRASRIACLNTELYHHGDPESFHESDALERAYGSTGQVVGHHH
ncbi:metal ABC transporter ATP-binding protein [Natronomonas gomsonensis]|jgi:zinc transport system ATP-binding protein|uniref:metal ABC transporter ATP-binding protein n=1 Tax=Natronomonas TaxID=63743 RepID=UPI0012EAB8B2|nr:MULTISPECIES: metal ABC transporter ATP-binding protein [Natronomonas]MCY4729411.1 metal ABC transporter ATP-binding protein [Natronomonas gomsonensis]MUV85971.1 ATP-binding cassette domain-containing protein [Natronomonas sp. CBA1123]